MKKKVIISIIAFSLIIGGTVLTNAKPKSNLAKMWGNVLSKDYEKKESKKNNEYRISLYGKISEKTEEINDIAEEGKDILIATDEIDKAEEFYKINGNDEEVAKEKAKSYVEGQNALYIEAIKKGYDVTDKELDQYIAELKETVSTAENREVAQDILILLIRKKTIGNMKENYIRSYYLFRNMLKNLKMIYKTKLKK